MSAVTLASLILASREATDTVGDSFISDSWLTTRVNAAIEEVWDQLVDAGPPDRFVARTAPFSGIAGASVVDMPLTVRNLINVWCISGVERVALLPLPTSVRAGYSAPSRAWQVEIDYIPTAPILVNAGDTFDGVAGGAELVTQLVARDIAVRRDKDRSGFNERIAMLSARVDARARRYDRGHGQRPTDLDEVAYRGASQSPLTHYKLMGGTLEVFER